MKLLSLFLFLGLSQSVYSQELFTELSPAGRITNITGMMIGDDIFLSADVSDKNGKASSKSFLIHQDGTKQPVDIDLGGDKQLIAGVRQGDSTFFYYLYAINERVVIESVVVDNQSSKRYALSNSTDVPGKIYGSYVEKGSLFMLCGIKGEFTLRLLEFRSGNFIKHTNFPLSIDLAKKKEGIVSFFDTTYPTTPQQAAAVMKLVKNKDVIWIIFDEPYKDFDRSVTESSMFKTTVIKLDLITAKVEIKAFFEPQRYPFTSAMVDGYLYRLVIEPSSQRIDQFSFETGKFIKSATLNRGKESGRDSTYAHISGRFRTEKDVKGAYIIKRVFGRLLIVDPASPTEQILTVGHYGDHFIGAFFGPTVAGLVLTAAALIVREVSEFPISTVYSYYKGSMDTGFTATYNTPDIRKVVDDYEYKQLITRVRYSYRGYLYQPGFTYAIYVKNNTNRIEILKFRK